MQWEDGEKTLQISFLGRNQHPSSSSGRAVLVYGGGGSAPLLMALEDGGVSAESEDLFHF